MKNISILEMQKYLSQQDGGSCSICDFTLSHSRLTLLIEDPNSTKSKIEMHLFFTEHINGPTQWNNCKLEISVIEERPLFYKVYDLVAGFEIVGCEEVNINNEFNLMIAKI